ncbi:uncharacterized protein LOC116164413 isoform X2 [Photinus pyralis]|nr:uncharacterized protein LOC116164413 isoform X2 [Photinus pyralis]
MIYSRIVVVSVFIVYPVICTVDLLRKYFNESATDWFCTLVSLMDSTIFIIVFFIRRSFDKALRTFERPSFDANEYRGAYDEEKKMLRDWLALSIKFIYTFTIPGLLVCGGQIFLSLAWRIVKSDPKDWWLPWGSMSLVNVKESPNFELLWFYQSAVIAIYCINIIPMVMVIVGSLTFLTVQLKMLQNYLGKIINMTQSRTVQYASNSCVLSWKYLNEYLNDVVEYHSMGFFWHFLFIP